MAELQSDVLVTDESISGTLHYVSDYTGFSGSPELQSGNYLALRFNSNADTVEIRLNPSSLPDADYVALDSEMNAVLRITDPETQVLHVRLTTGGEQEIKTYSLSGLECETPGL